MIDFEEALRIILNNTKTLDDERIFLDQALNRVLFKDIYAKENIPSFDNAAMDGFALLNEDLLPLKNALPVKLKIAGEVSAGAKPIPIKKGEAVKIYTGAPIPQGADTVIELELTKVNADEVEILAYKEKGSNIRRIGEDIKKGDLLLESGKVLRGYELGILASQNIVTFDVFRMPRVGIFVTGDEVLDVGQEKTSDAQIRSSNHISIMGLLESMGVKPTFLGIIKDDKESIKNALNRIEEFDILISTGGVSVSDKDFTKEAVKELGFDVKFHKVAIKPGKPIVFATKGDKLFFGLPGNPVSCVINFDIFVRPSIKKMMGYKDIIKPFMRAKLIAPIKRKSSDRLEFLRGILNLEQELLVEALPKQGSHMLTEFRSANCYILVPKGVNEIPAGEFVDVIMFSSYIR
ncbi:molybdenum cofactor synthesis domain protein [Hydrogenobaculum sp. Y04AAS1]|uniref:molybdopterin-binding protein n=1 Tax=Hydrogenobaculum sp. (strain Y04AAS1) TaxID=380749 RepID=UPI00017BBD99|nr:molybdenum cofactor synthesis domain protein [Hydrogenobaculum sp. Y04AAS1]HCT66909.1 molybdopterin molybdenumtransferase MoeA [Hydrogenobaculum sp.]